MNSSASAKEIVKSLNSYLSSSSISTDLPSRTAKYIQSAIEKTPDIDDSTASRLQDDLLSIHSKLVARNESRRPAFLHALTLLQPWIEGQRRPRQWWELVIRPVLDFHGRLRVEVERASDFMSKVLNYDLEDDKGGAGAKEAAHLIRQLLDAYFARTNAADPETQDYSVEDEHIASQFEAVLIDFGRNKPQDLLLALDEHVVQPKHRQQSLALLSTFVRGQPPHLDLVSETSLIEHLIQCLMIDTSATAIQIALTTLIMFLPHIPSSIRAHLPRLFLIYSRLLCWDRVDKPKNEEEYFSPDEDDDVKLEKTPSDEDQAQNPGWKKLEGMPDESALTLDVSYYFTFLYGLYPMNFTSYIKKPRRYLKSINFPRADQLELEQDLIKSRTGPLRGIHLLHPNFYETTAEDELEDDRWFKSDAAEVVAECISLRVSLLSTSQPLAPPPTSKLPEPPGDAIHPNLNGDESPVDGTMHFNLDQSARTSKRPPRRPSRPPTGIDPGDSPTLPPLGDPPRRLSTSTASLSTTDPSKSLLLHQLASLRASLNFERYLKQEHLAHIGQLQRRHIADATMAANTENLLNTNKSLKTKLDKSSDAYLALKKETATGRTQSKRYESDLSGKVRNLRDAERVWQSEESTLKLELQKARSDCDALRKIVVETEARELLATQKVGSLELQNEQVGRLRERVEDLESQLRIFESKDLEYSRTANDVDILRMDLATANLQLQAKDGEIARLRRNFEQRAAELEMQLSTARQAHDATDADGLSPERRQKVQEAMERAVNAANDRTIEIRKKYAALTHTSAELEIRCQELEVELDAHRGPEGKSVPIPKRSGTAPMAVSTGASAVSPTLGGLAANNFPVSAHWRNSTGTPTTDTDESASSPSRPPRPDAIPTLRRSSRGASSALAAAAQAEQMGTSPVLASTSAPTKNPPLPVSPRGNAFNVTPTLDRASIEGDNIDPNTGGGGSSAPTASGGGSGFYMNKKSAWSVDSLDSGQTGESGKTKGSKNSGKSAGSSFFGKPGVKTEGEAEEERKRREARRRQPPKGGGLRGLRGLI